MTVKKSIWTNTLFIEIIIAIATIIGGYFIFKAEFNYQRKIQNEDNQTQDITTLRQDFIALRYENLELINQIRTNRIIDSLDYNELDKRLLKLENK
jgi:hypothetical protein